MTIAPTRSAQRGFTLIELLIVVIILAILAAIVIPQFANTTSDAREGALDANLSTMRSAIELYKIQHKNVYPGAIKSTGNGTVPTCTLPGAGAVGSAQAFIDQLTYASDAAGNTCSVAGPTYPYGPYFRGAVPSEPINNKGTVSTDIQVQTTGVKLDPAATVLTGGWFYDTVSGQVVMNSGANDSKGIKYSAH